MSIEGSLSRNRSSGAEGRRSAASALGEADDLALVGRLVDAVDHLVAFTKESADVEPEVAVRLVALRRDAAAAGTPGAGRAPWPPAYPDPFPQSVARVPEITGEELDPDLLGGAVAHHGCLKVRSLFTDAQVQRTVAGIEQARSTQDQGTVDPWYQPLRCEPQMENQVLRNMVAAQGGIWLGDSPACAHQVLTDLELSGAIGAIGGHFGERLCFSLQKSTLRRSEPEYRLAAWHQDGSFLTPGVRTMNVWVALSSCGGSHPAPALEVIPRRFDEVLPIDGVMSPHAMSYELIDELAEVTPTVVPDFEPGDALLFDERFVHRTHLTEEMTEVRYALECWFFAPSHPAEGYTPLLV